MKLIIDIDKDYVKIINKNGASNYSEEVIKNGIPLDEVDRIEDIWSEVVDKSSNLKGPYDISFHKGIRLHDLEKIFDKYVERVVIK